MELDAPRPHSAVFAAARDALGRNVVDFDGERARRALPANKRFFEKPDALVGRVARIWSPARDHYNPYNRGQPHNRDVSYVIVHGGALLEPAIARDTLLACLWRVGERLFIGGQYWDKIGWTTAAWRYYLATGDADFLALAYDATWHTLFTEAGTTRPFHNTNLPIETPIGNLVGHEWNPDTGLFQGADTFGDGRSKYPEPYHAGWEAGMNVLTLPQALGWNKVRLECLGTNVLYCNAFACAARAAEQLGRPQRERDELAQRAEALKAAINDRLWDEEAGQYAYFLDEAGRPSAYRTNLGQSLAIIAGVADLPRARRILENVHTTEHGIPCTWPIFERFDHEGLEHLGAGNGPIWPFIQGFAGWAGAVADEPAFLERMMAGLARMVEASDHVFYEAYHLIHGTPYKGWHGPVDDSRAQYKPPKPDQTWSASGYLAMVLRGVFGVAEEPEGIRFDPAVPPSMDGARLRGIACRGLRLDVTVRGRGTRVRACRVDGVAREPFVAFREAGSHTVELEMAPAPADAETASEVEEATRHACPDAGNGGR